MSQIQSTNTSYFLTKQTANLQEDFDREIKNSASLFLLYGEAGVGKTRLLRELVSTRLNQLRVHWVDCKQAEDHFSATTELDSALERALNIANVGDIIIADHFELATNKIKHQLLQSWVTDGIDKKFSLIIATGPAGLEEVRNLAARYSLNVKSFQLLPLTRTEIDGYCASELFPLLLPSPLSMPKQTRRALNGTRGLIGNLRDIVGLHSNHIVMRDTPRPLSIVKPLVVVFGLTIILLLAGLTHRFMPVSPFEYFLLNQADVNKPESTQTIQSSKIESPKLPEPAAELTPIEAIDSPIIKLEESSVIKEVEAEKAIIVEVEKVEAEKVLIVEVEKVEADNLPKVEPVNVVSSVGLTQQESYSDWFNTELKRSRDWFETTERSRATIQIMSINLDDTTDDTYFSYVKTLQQSGVDVSQLRVYMTRVQENILFSIVYGNYNSRRVASISITNLPSSLGANQPISRSVGGIWDEINQF